MRKLISLFLDRENQKAIILVHENTQEFGKKFDKAIRRYELIKQSIVDREQLDLILNK